MLTPTMIIRLATQERSAQLLESLSNNGQNIPLALQGHLTQSPVPALALGLRRVVELARRSSPAVEPLTERLLAAQSPDGSFDQNPLTTALAAAALGALIREHDVHEPQVTHAHQQAIEALAALQEEDARWFTSHAIPPHGHGPSLAVMTDHHAHLCNAFILQLLARDPLARQQLRLEELLDWFDHQPSSSFCRDTQSQLRIARVCLPRTAAA